jgi:hydrogenase-4 component B
MRMAMIILAGCCMFIGLFSSIVLRFISRSIGDIAGIEKNIVDSQILPVCQILNKITIIAFGFLAIVLVISFIRKKILSAKKVRMDVTWDCGYAKPSARMQYTASSFAGPLLDTFKMILRTKKKIKEIKGLFPSQGEFESSTPELSRDYIFRPIFQAIYSALDKLRWLQHGNIQLYILYIALTLVILMIWKLR